MVQMDRNRGRVGSRIVILGDSDECYMGQSASTLLLSCITQVVDQICLDYISNHIHQSYLKATWTVRKTNDAMCIRHCATQAFLKSCMAVPQRISVGCAS
jgi:hypothetical protein